MAELNKFDTIKLALCRKKIAADMFPATSADALEAALEMEATAKAMSPFDPVIGRFFEKRDTYFQIAELLEKMEKK